MCACPIYCKYCGDKLRRDSIGHYCPTHNCQWEHGVKDCVPQVADATGCPDDEEITTFGIVLP